MLIAFCTPQPHRTLSGCPCVCLGGEQCPSLSDGNMSTGLWKYVQMIVQKYHQREGVWVVRAWRCLLHLHNHWSNVEMSFSPSQFGQFLHFKGSTKWLTSWLVVGLQYASIKVSKTNKNKCIVLV